MRLVAAPTTCMSQYALKIKVTGRADSSAKTNSWSLQPLQVFFLSSCFFHLLYFSPCSGLVSAKHFVVKLFVLFFCHQRIALFGFYKKYGHAIIYEIRGGVEDTRLEAKAKAKDTKKIRGQGQGQGQPFRGQNLSRPRTGMLEAKAKDQGHRRKCSPKKKSSKIFFRRSPIRWRTENLLG